MYMAKVTRASKTLNIYMNNKSRYLVFIDRSNQVSLCKLVDYLDFRFSLIMANFAGPQQRVSFRQTSTTCSNDMQLQGSHRDDWDFLRGFFQREDMAAQQIQSLNGHIIQLKAALQHAGHSSQQDRIALNKSHDHMKQLEETFLQSEVVRAQLENKLHEEEQEHRMCRANLNHEVQRHHDTEKRLECIWNAHNRLQDIMTKVNCVVDDGIESMPYDVTDLVLEIASKSQKIHDLEGEVQNNRHQHQLDASLLKEKLQKVSDERTEEYMAQEERLRELDSRLQRERMRFDPDTTPNSKQGQKRRRRSRAKSKADRGNTPNVPADIGPEPDEQRPHYFDGLPTVKEEPHTPETRIFGGLPAVEEEDECV